MTKKRRFFKKKVTALEVRRYRKLSEGEQVFKGGIRGILKGIIKHIWHA